jgi:hypothetical protein
MTKKYILTLIFFSFGLKILYLSFAIAFEKTDRSQTLYEQYKRAAWKNDSGYYQRIADEGYPAKKDFGEISNLEEGNYVDPAWAFFPLYPLAIKSISKVLKIKHVDSTFLISILFSTLSIIGVFWFGLIFYKDESLAFFAPFVLFCFPFTYYYSMFYTEALFLTFMIFSFIAIHYKNYIALSFLLIPLVLIRPNGVIALIPLYLFYLERNGILNNYKIYWNKLLNRKNIITSLAFATGPIIFLLYCYYQYNMTGHFFAFSLAQKGWNKELTFPLFSFFNRGDPANKINSIFTIIVMIYSVFIWKKLPLSLNVLIWISLLLPLSAGSVMSMTRYISVVFPLFLILSASIYKFKYRYFIVFGFLIIQLITFYPWLIRHPIGF